MNLEIYSYNFLKKLLQTAVLRNWGFSAYFKVCFVLLNFGV